MTDPLEPSETTRDEALATPASAPPGLEAAAQPPATSGPPASAAPGEQSKRDSVLEVAVVVLVALLLALVLKVYVAEAYMIRGQSMQPTFADGERVMVQKCLYDIERGDVIIFSAGDPAKDLIKRVIGLPGDRVVVRDSGEVVVNGKALKETYIQKSRNRPESRSTVVPADSFYVLGDNRAQSQDSRTFGTVRRDSIKGKVILRWWPLEDLRTF